jgi:hypothetical protein
MKSKKSIVMNWKKWIKYTVVFLIIIASVGLLWITREGKRMYGGLTERVNYEQFNPKVGLFAIKNVNMLSADGDSIIPNQTIVIENGLITAIDSTLNLSSETTIIDGTGKYVIPGLIDTHVHLFQSPNDLLLYIANGVTEIRELIGEESHLVWKQEIENGRIGPKMFVASPRLGSFEPMEGWFMSWTQGYMNIENAEDARETVKSLYEEGYDGLKIYSQLTKESYVALTETAKSLGMPVMGHIPWSLELSDIWQYGQSDIAHFEELMNALGREFSNSRNIGGFNGEEDEFLKFVEERSEALANNLLKSDITVTSSLWLNESFAKQPFNLEQVLKDVELDYENPGISEWVSFIPQGLGWLPEVNRYRLPEKQTAEEREGSKKYWETYAKACQLIARNLAKRGVKIIAGTDANLPPVVPGFSLHNELESLHRAGMSTSQVLQAATAVPAAWLKSNSGKILPGYEANLVLLEKNPLEDISNTKTINTVIVKGKVFDRALLDDLLAAVKQANDRSRKISIDKYRKKEN